MQRQKLTVNVVLRKGQLKCIRVLKKVHFELAVYIREVDEDQRVGTWAARHPLPHPLHHDHHLAVSDCPLQLLRLGSGLYERAGDDGGDGEEEQQEGDQPCALRHCWTATAAPWVLTLTAALESSPCLRVASTPAFRIHPPPHNCLQRALGRLPRFPCLPPVDCDLPRQASQRWPRMCSLPRLPMISHLHLPGHWCLHRQGLVQSQPRHHQGLAVISPCLGRCTWLPAMGSPNAPSPSSIVSHQPNILSPTILLLQFETRHFIFLLNPILPKNCRSHEDFVCSSHIMFGFGAFRVYLNQSPSAWSLLALEQIAIMLLYGRLTIDNWFTQVLYENNNCYYKSQEICTVYLV